MSHYSAQELFQVFIKLINLFEFTAKPIKNVFELSDGVVLFKLVTKLSPEYFDVNAFDLRPQTKDSKNNNIIHIKQCLEQFFNDVIDTDIAVDSMIDHNKITSYASFNDEDVVMRHFVRLVEMILLFSIKCENKAITIGKMQSLQMQDQATLMQILQALMTNTGFLVNENNNNQNKEKTKHENSNTVNEKKLQTQTPVPSQTSFRKLSTAKYSNGSRQSSLLSPFGSKRKAKKTISSRGRERDMPPCHGQSKDTYLQKQMIKLQDANLNLTEEIESLRQQNTDISAKFSQLQKELSSNENDAKKLRKKLSSEHEKKEKALKAQIESNQEEILKYKEQIKYNNEEINEYKLALMQVQEENQKYVQQLQDINDLHARKMRELQDELDISQHQESQAHALEQRIKSYQIRLESMNDIQAELVKYKQLYQEKSDTICELKNKLQIIPSLKQQIERHKKDAIKYKVASIASGNGFSDKQLANQIASLEERNSALTQQTDELKLNLNTARKEVISLQAQLSATSDRDDAYGYNVSFSALGGVTPDVQSQISKLQAENKRLKAMAKSQHTMNDLIDEVDTKTKLLQTTEAKYRETQQKLNEVNEELENMKKTIAEWVLHSNIKIR